MTDRELADAAWLALTKTTDSYPTWKRKGFPPTNWAKAKALIDQIGKPTPPVQGSSLGVYRGAINPAGVASFGTWLGKPVQYAGEFLDGGSWAGIEGPGWLLDPWKGKPYTLVLGVPLYPSGGTLAQGAAGVYDAHFRTLATNLVAAGHGNAILRLGWEFGGNWYIWNPGTLAEAADFKAFWRRIVTAMRPVAPGLRYDWNGVWGWQGMPPETCYPGDDVVDYIGVDVYDQSWKGGGGYPGDTVAWADFWTSNWGGKWFTDFAATHNKPLSIPEWGLCRRGDTPEHGGLDNPAFIDHMADWFAAVATSPTGLGYHCYFDVNAPDGAHALSGFPNGQARYLARFG